MQQPDLGAIRECQIFGRRNDTFGGITPPLTYTAGKAAQVPCSFVAGISNGKWTEPNGLKTVCMPAA